VEMRPLGVPRGVMPNLYSMIRESVGESLCLRAARQLVAVPAGSTVFIATGAGASGVLPNGESDGPLGAAALARILNQGLDLHTILITTAGYEGPVKAALDAYGASADVLTMPAEMPLSEAERSAEMWFHEYRPAAAVAVEQKGAAADGNFYFMTGRLCIEDARLDSLFTLAPRFDCLTVGVGDGGNEVGFGRFQSAVHHSHPHGSKIASTIETDEFVVAAISNWGCYGIEAMVAFLLERPSLLHSPDIGVQAMEAVAAAGAGDGIYTRMIPFEDGQPGTIHAALIAMLSQIITNGLTRVEHALTVRQADAS
jgi:D-glutamate cyclase